LQAAASTLGVQLQILRASSEGDFAAIFAATAQFRCRGARARTGCPSAWSASIGRILNGEKPARPASSAEQDYRMTLNLKTAKALGLTVPPTLLALADDVIK
jgi:hypothetical protein